MTSKARPAGLLKRALAAVPSVKPPALLMPKPGALAKPAMNVVVAPLSILRMFWMLESLT